MNSDALGGAPEEMGEYIARRMVKGKDYATLAAAFLSFLLSVSLWFSGNKESGLFVGLWVPSIIGIGIYFKLMAGGSNHG